MKTKVNMSQYLYWFFIINTVVCEQVIIWYDISHW
jgi:hypothetical protein